MILKLTKKGRKRLDDYFFSFLHQKKIMVCEVKISRSMSYSHMPMAVSRCHTLSTLACGNAHDFFKKELWMIVTLSIKNFLIGLIYILHLLFTYFLKES